MADDPREKFRVLMYSTKFSEKELKIVLQSQLFKDFAATYPKQSEWSKRPKTPPNS